MIMRRDGRRGAGVFRDNDAYEWRDTARAGAEQGGRVAGAEAEAPTPATPLPYFAALL